MAKWLLFVVASFSLVLQALCTAGDICYILGARNALLNNQLFFMSGYYTYVTYNGQDIAPASSLYSLNMTTDFPVERTIPESSVNNHSIPSSASIANTDQFNVSVPLWYTNDTIYIFAGVGEPTSTLPSYNITSGTWQSVHVAGGDFSFGNRSYAQSVSVPDSGLSFASGGVSPYGEVKW
ncbi:hypothetical protein B0A55_08479 [Friedmanniomyces simplex]|uniref:Uncharacterized protein n=2 Tax=Friedmanniomyces simplex TaxID=329884 RepID=A0A4U0X169_9PEZI|nr:hypothetical protein B0A55_08479 [Friedmanniomyces simplex]